MYILGPRSVVLTSLGLSAEIALDLLDELNAVFLPESRCQEMKFRSWAAEDELSEQILVRSA